MDFLDENISQYAEAHTDLEPQLLAELNRDTYANVLIPRMLSGHMQGRILSFISKLHQPKRILEIGTYTGYSALCLAEGLAPGGRLDTIDINEELQSRIERFVGQSKYKDAIHLHIGNAIDVIPNLDGEFDLVFIDADKENYSNYYDMVIDRMAKGGVIIADNVLWSGKVIDENQRLNDEETKALDQFNKKIQSDNRVENILMPVRDGLMCIRKK